MKQKSNVFICPDNEQFKNENNDTRHVTNALTFLKKNLNKKINTKKIVGKYNIISRGKALKNKVKKKKRKEKKKKKKGKKRKKVRKRRRNGKRSKKKGVKRGKSLKERTKKDPYKQGQT